MKASTQCAACVKKAKSMLGIIRRGIENKMGDIVMPLYSAVSFRILCTLLFTVSQKKKRTAKLEEVLKRATKMIRRLEQLPYKEM